MRCRSACQEALTELDCQEILTTMTEADRLWARWRRLIASSSPDPLEVARLASTFERYFDAIKTEAVRAARASGHSWEEVASTLGTSRQSAWEKYRRAGRALSGPRWPVPLTNADPTTST